jgi:fucose 4-O-acetylase-like acetyltransferase
MCQWRPTSAEGIAPHLQVAARAPRAQNLRASGTAEAPADQASAVRSRLSGRNDLIDALKFFAIALVILTHVLRLRGEFIHLSPGLLRIIVSFNLPLFTFLSGWVLAGREGSRPLRFLRGKALALLVPYFAWIAVEMPLRHVQPSGYVARLYHAALDPMAGMQMWYLWALFFMFVVFTLGRLVSTSEWWTAAVAVAVGSIALFIPGGASGIDRVTWLYPYLILGYLCAMHRPRLRRYDRLATAVAVVAFAALSAWPSGLLVFKFAAGAAGTVAACGLFGLVPRAALSWPARAGRLSLGIYGWQMVVFPFLIVGLGWPGAVASWFIVLAVATALSFVLSRFTVTRAVFLGQWPRRARQAT